MTSKAAGPRRRSDAEPLTMEAFHRKSRTRRKLPELRHHREKRDHRWRSEKAAIRVASRVGRKRRYLWDSTHFHPCLNRRMSSITTSFPWLQKLFFSSNETKREEEKPSNRENPVTCGMTILISKLYNMPPSEMPRNAGIRQQF